MAAPAPAGEESEHRVTPLELFFDLVFVFTLTQVTTLVAADPTWEQVVRGLLVLGALWWAWCGYAWLTSTIDPEEGGVRLVFFAAMAAWVVAGLAVPRAFNEDAEVFGVAYLAVRVAHIGVFMLAARDDAGLRGAVVRSVPFWVGAPLLLVVAGFLDGTAQGVLWVVALTIDYGSGLLGGGSGWRLHPHHFAERHALIVIVALGESVVAVGAGAAGVELDAGALLAAGFGLVVACAIWWSYFDVAAIVAERRLSARQGVEQARQARDAYTYLHLPMVAGIVLFAFAMKKVLAHDDEPLAAVPAAALAGGVALYLLAHIAFRLRNTRTLNRLRLGVALVLVALAPVADEVDAVAAVGAVAALTAGLIAVEAARSREARHRIRHAR